jgi:hypothetical protein
MTMVLLPAASGGELCLNPDTASWILPLDPGSSCQVLMANGTSYDIALGVRSIQEIFAERFIELMLAQPMPSKPDFVLVNPLQTSSIEANDEQTSYVVAPGSKQLVVGSVTTVSAAFNNTKVV